MVTVGLVGECTPTVFLEELTVSEFDAALNCSLALFRSDGSPVSERGKEEEILMAALYAKSEAMKPVFQFMQTPIPEGQNALAKCEILFRLAFLAGFRAKAVMDTLRSRAI